jgi:hypothetical protein
MQSQMYAAAAVLNGRRERRGAIVRKRNRGGIARERSIDGARQLRLDLYPSVREGERLWEYAVRVTDVGYPIEAIGQRYRDRADTENGFDLLKNRWGLAGFTTQDLTRCRTTARACAVVCNRWRWCCRAAHPTARMEAITSRPPLLARVGGTVSHAGQTTLHLKLLHGKKTLLKALIANIHAALRHVRATAEQFGPIDPWTRLVRDVAERIAPSIGPPWPLGTLPVSG